MIAPIYMSDTLGRCVSMTSSTRSGLVRRASGDRMKRVDELLPCAVEKQDPRAFVGSRDQCLVVELFEIPAGEVAQSPARAYRFGRGDLAIDRERDRIRGFAHTALGRVALGTHHQHQRLR